MRARSVLHTDAAPRIRWIHTAKSRPPSIYIRAMPIVPDAKDWTWVLERPCRECGFDAQGFAREELAQRLRENVKLWEAELTRDDARIRPNPERWSVLEYACHVRDVFRIYDGRVSLMQRDDNPEFPNWDQDETAVADR